MGGADETSGGGAAALHAYRDQALSALSAVGDEAELTAWYQAHLAPSGQANGWKRLIGKQPADQRKQFGVVIHEVTGALDQGFAARREAVTLAEQARQLAAERLDVTLPPRATARGGVHPITAMTRTLLRVFQDMGFSVFESPHVELDHYNFELLNMPAHHPARDMQDTFYASESVVLRTHTSAGQIRAMRALGPGPVRVVLPGLCYRNEDVTARSEMQFVQIEGLVVGPDVRMSDLKGLLLQFAKSVFGGEQAVRFRGSYFPFTEPSVEVDVRCSFCGGAGCRLCKYTGWLELLGAGLVHPVVLRNGGYDPEKNRGIAFGMGVPRMVMLLHGVDDIRNFYRNDLRFLSQFR